MASRPSEPLVLHVRGGATGAELAAVTAVLAARGRPPARTGAEPGPYERWRRGRLAAIAGAPGRTPR